jgi:hypothetical protein
VKELLGTISHGVPSSRIGTAESLSPWACKLTPIKVADALLGWAFKGGGNAK